MTQTVNDMRKLAGKFVLFFAGCWLMVVIGAVSGTARGTSIPALNWAFILLPGGAFIPAAYFAVKLHLAKYSEQLQALWPKSLLYGTTGLILLFGGAYALYRTGGSGA